MTRAPDRGLASVIQRGFSRAASPRVFVHRGGTHCPPDSTCDAVVTCEVLSLGAGKTATITIVVTPTKKGSLSDKATVTASGVSSDTDDEATATTTVLGS